MNDFVKNDNEACFLPDNDKIRYHSLILYEFFDREKFDVLVEGLDELYIKLNPIDRSRLPSKDMLQNNGVLFNKLISRLPYISNSQFKGKVLPNRVFYDLGENLNHLDLSLYEISPSIAVLEIKAYLNERVSDEINEIIYNNYDVKIEPVETVSGKYEKMYYPSHIKEMGINEIKTNVKSELIDFISTYFRGCFFKLSGADVSVVPSIELYSMNYPDNNEDIIKWGSKNSTFFHCFNSYISPYTYGDKHYLFCEESGKKIYRNFLIFANRNISNNSDLYLDKDQYIEESLDTWHQPFVLLALSRWLKIEEKIVLDLNATISKEIRCLAEDRLGDIFESRKEISKELYYFERFKIEFAENRIFKSPNFNQLEGESNLYDYLITSIRMKIEKINENISIINEHSNNIFSLKNIEYGKNMQESVERLTIVIIGFTIIQIILAIKIPEYISARFFS